MPNIYLSTDAGAPQLTSAVSGPGSWLELFRIILTQGYGAFPGAGWARAFFQDKEEVFQQGAGPPGSIPYFLKMVHDSGVNLFLYAYEFMADISTGTNGFGPPGTRPTSIDSALAHQWACFADQRTFYMFYEAESGSGFFRLLGFGDFFSYGTSPYRCFLVNLANGTARLNIDMVQGSGNPFGEVCRSHDGLMIPGVSRFLSAAAVGAIHGSGVHALQGNMPYPSPAGGQLWLAPIYVSDYFQPSIRGKLRGLWMWCHQISGIANGDQFPGTGEFAGKTFAVVKYLQHPGDSVMIVETSNTWLTNG